MSERKDTRYFAAVESSDELAQLLHTRIEAYYDWHKKSGRTERIKKSRAVYNGMSVNGTGAVTWDVIQGGQQGETLQSRENWYQSIIDTKVSDVTAQRPAIQCGASNSDYRSMAQALLGNGICEHYLTEMGLEALRKRSVRAALVDTEGWIGVTWDAQGGDAYAPQDEEFSGVVKKGDVQFRFYGPFDVIRDEYAESHPALQWAVARRWENRHDLAALYSEKSAEILGLETKRDKERRIEYGARTHDETDLVAVYDFWHKKSPAMPQGRMMTLLAGDCWLYDGPNPYADGIPLYPCVDGWLEGTPFGTSSMIHLLGAQDAVDALDSTILTNQLGRGIGNMVVDDDADVSVEALSTSMNVIKKKKGSELAALEFPATPAELFDYRQEKIRSMQTRSGVNSVRMGEPSENVGSDSSGAKLALLEAQAIKSNSSIEASANEQLRAICLAILQRLRDFGGDIPRLVKMAGKNGQYLVKEFTAADISDIDRVTVDVGNPIMRTITGKMSIADKVMELPEAMRGPYLALLKAGTYEPLLEGDQSVQMRIRAENEALAEGQPRQAAVTDPHWIEIAQHRSVLDNPALRESGVMNEAVAGAVLDHIQEHLDLFRSMDPGLVAILGGQAAQALWQALQPMLPVDPAAAPGASGAPPPEGGMDSAGQPMAPVDGLPAEPQLPINPSTGEPNPGPEAMQ